MTNCCSDTSNVSMPPSCDDLHISRQIESIKISKTDFKNRYPEHELDFVMKLFNDDPTTEIRMTQLGECGFNYLCVIESKYIKQVSFKVTIE